MCPGDGILTRLEGLFEESQHLRRQEGDYPTKVTILGMWFSTTDLANADGCLG
jgi:hypothetical protein